MHCSTFIVFAHVVATVCVIFIGNFNAQCYCGWKFSHANSENLLKWLKILFTAIQQMATLHLLT